MREDVWVGGKRRSQASFRALDLQLPCAHAEWKELNLNSSDDEKRQKQNKERLAKK